MMIAMKIVSSQHPLHCQCCLTPQLKCVEERDDSDNHADDDEGDDCDDNHREDELVKMPKPQLGVQAEARQAFGGKF